MKRHDLLVLAIILALPPGCSKDSATAPQAEDRYTLEATQVVGTAGGTIALSDLALIIPPGAFPGDRTLEVYASSKDKPFAQNQVTRTFRVEGLPDRYLRPLRLRIKYDGVLSGEPYVASGSWFLDCASGDTTVGYCLHAARDSSAHLTVAIPALLQTPSGPSPSNARPVAARGLPAEVLILVGLTGHDTIETDHFAIEYPRSLVSVNMSTVAATLEDLYRTIAVYMQIPWTRTKPLETVLWEMDPGGASYLGLPVWGWTSDYVLNLGCHELRQGDYTKVRLRAGGALLYMTQIVLDPSCFEASNRWFHLAVDTWSEGEFTDDAGYLSPSGFRGNEMAPFEGMRAGAGDGHFSDRETRHGHGMSAVIKYLAESPAFTPAGVGGTYETIRTTGAAATAALLRNVQSLAADWWPRFFKSYLAGEVYGVGRNVFTDGRNLSGTWTVDDESDTLSVFTGRFPDLSAKLYMVNLSSATMSESADLALKFGGHIGTHEPLGVMAFGVGNTSLEYWGHSTAQGSTTLIVPRLRELYDAGWRQILVAAVCSNVSDTYLANTDADLEIRVVQEEEIPGYDSFDFGLHVVGHWRFVAGSYSSDYEGNHDLEPWGYLDVVPGEMTEPHVFSGGFASQGATGEVIATLNATRDTLLSVSVEMEWPEAASGVMRSTSFVATEVPLWSDDEDWTWFLVRGAAVCEYLDVVQYVHNIPSQAETTTLTGYHCTSAGANPSSLSLRFHKQAR